VAEPAAGRHEATIVTQTRVQPGQTAQFTCWQEQMSEVAAQAPGFVSQEIIPADPPVQEDWVIIQRFRSREDARAWLGSADRARMLREAEVLLQGQDAISIMDGTTRPAARQASTAVIRTRVVAGGEARFRQWSAEMSAAQSRMPGYIGSAVQEPIPGVQDQWVTMLAFDTPEHLQAWLRSPARAALLGRAQTLMADTETRVVKSGFEGWFDIGQPAGQPAAPAWKLNYLILAGLYPIVMLEVLFLNNKLAWMNPAFSTLIGNIFSVAFLGWPVVAILSRLMGWWIQPSALASRSTDLKGAVIMIAVLAVLLTGFFFIVNHVGSDAKVFRV
jgi:antibiotic biosynthesis monooxygenase (ABM) superfamily enzyme